MHQNLAVILWQFNYSKNSFIVMIAGVVIQKLANFLCSGQHVLLSTTSLFLFCKKMGLI